MIKIEKRSKVTKKDIISRAIERVKSNDLSESFHMIRGNAFNTEKIHFLGIVGSEENTAMIKGVVKAFDVDHRSRHQVDYIVASFVNRVAIAEIKGLGGMDSEQRMSKIKGIVEATINSEPEQTLMILVMSRKNIEVITYGIVESSFKNEVSITVSPEPLTHIKERFSNTKMLVGASELPNFFKITEKEERVLKTCDLHLNEMFFDEESRFSLKSAFIEKRELIPGKNKKKKKSAKFGY